MLCQTRNQYTHIYFINRSKLFLFFKNFFWNKRFESPIFYLCVLYASAHAIPKQKLKPPGNWHVAYSTHQFFYWVNSICLKNNLSSCFNYFPLNIIQFDANFSKQFPYKYHHLRPICIKANLPINQFTLLILKAKASKNALLFINCELCAHHCSR